MQITLRSLPRRSNRLTRQVWLSSLFLAGHRAPTSVALLRVLRAKKATRAASLSGFSKFLSRLEKLVKPRDTVPLIENVLMQNPGDVRFFTDALQAQPVLLDPADFSIISRPRLFWTRLRWCDLSSCPMTGKPLQWQKVHKLPKLILDLPRVTTDDIQTDGLEFHDKVRSGQAKLPCLTTPAPNQAGRPPPKKMKGHIPPSVKLRWQQDNRQYAPWHYQDTAMLSDSTGRLHTPPIAVKEQLQGFPAGFTQAPGVHERARHRMLANAWHFQVAKLLILLILSQCGALAAPTPAPRTSALQFVLELAANEPLLLGPTQWTQQVCTKRPTFNMWDHWEATDQAVHPLFCNSHIEPGIIQVFDKWRRWGDVNRLRLEVIADLQRLADDFREIHDHWKATLPNHVAKVYSQSGGFLQVPLWMWLLEQIKYPDVTTLAKELTVGFPTTGQLSPGAGWLPRLDSRYTSPISREEFLQVNKAYVARKLNSRLIDPHWKSMLDELVQEHQMGRVDGPFETPAEWGVPGTSVNGLPMMPAPHHHVLSAGCFAVQQSDKVRRCEDWRRSGHNSTVRVSDSPLHHTVDNYIASAVALADGCNLCLTWGHDMASAYRQFAVACIEENYTFMRTPGGVVLFRHNAMSFGAVSSVWSFNRAADTLTTLARKLLWCPSLHFVDDFGATEPAPLAESGFRSFALLFEVLGLQTKAKKAQPPAKIQKILGVMISTTTHDASLHPCPQRVERLMTNITTYLQSNRLTPEEAQTLSGKLIFLQTTSFGQMGMALLAPLYARAHHLPSDRVENDQLTHALTAVLTTLRALIPCMPPRRFPFQADQPVTVLYTDAFFKLGEHVWHASDHENIPKKWDTNQAPLLINGWGIVLKIGAQTLFCAGVIPPEVLKVFAKRKAYIFALEILTQVIAFVLLRKHFSAYVVSYIDNQPGQSCLSKGYGRDPAINCVMSFLWCWFGRLQIYPHFEWVPSAQNIADPISRFRFDMRAAEPEDGYQSGSADG